MMSETISPIVVKVGGSLYDWPELGPRLRAFLETLRPRPLLLVPGGGNLADAIRDLHRTHQFPETTAHWLALRSLTLAAHFLASLLPQSRIVKGLLAARAVARRGEVPIMDALHFARGDELRPGRLPHTWDATSDSVAARIAVVIRAERLILLKSADPPPDWMRTAGYVDPLFAATIVNAEFPVEAINLRAVSHEP